MILSLGDILRLLVATPTMLVRAGKPVVDLWRVQSNLLLLPTILGLILMYLCAKILHSMVSLGMVGLEHFAKLHILDSILESTKKGKMFWQLLRYPKKSFFIDYMKLAELYKIFHMPRLLHMK